MQVYSESVSTAWTSMGIRRCRRWACACGCSGAPARNRRGLECGITWRPAACRSAIRSCRRRSKKPSKRRPYRRTCLPTSRRPDPFRKIEKKLHSGARIRYIFQSPICTERRENVPLHLFLSPPLTWLWTDIIIKIVIVQFGFKWRNLGSALSEY